MEYTGTFKWHINDTTLINKILSAKCGNRFESHDSFQVGELNWTIKLYPNGQTEKSKGCCAVGVQLLGMPSSSWFTNTSSFPSSWKSIFCQCRFECPQMQSKMVFSLPYNKPYCWA
eukprot:954450_1